MNFFGTISSRDYAWAVVRRILVFLLVSLAFPFLLYGAVRSTNCGNDSCGAVSLVFSLASKPTIYLIFCLSLAAVTTRRLRDAGLNPWLALPMVVLLLGDGKFGMVFGSPWTVGFATGALSLALPHYLKVGILCIGALCLMPTDGVTLSRARWLSPLFAVALVIAALLGFLNLVDGFRGNPVPSYVGSWYGFTVHALLVAPVAIWWLAIAAWIREGAAGARTVWFGFGLACFLPTLVNFARSLFFLVGKIFGYSAAYYASMSSADYHAQMQLSLYGFLGALLLPLFLAFMQKPYPAGFRRVAAWSEKPQTLVAVAVGILVLFMWWRFEHPIPKLFYRMTVEVQTPEGPKSGTAVRAAVDAGGRNAKVEGEAVAVDLGRRGYLFALLKGAQPNAKTDGTPSMHTLVTLLDPKLDAINSSKERARALSNLRGTATLPQDQLPYVVRFRDPTNPNTIEMLDPNNLAAAFGPGVSLKAVTVEAIPPRYWPLSFIFNVGAPVTHSLREVLPWLKKPGARSLESRFDVGWEYLSGLRSEDFVPQAHVVRRASGSDSQKPRVTR